MNEKYTEINSKTIDQWVERGWEWGVPISHETYIAAVSGQWDVVLTPTINVPKEWFSPYYRDGKMSDVKLLGLASGGGQQMPVFAALGTDVTVSIIRTNNSKMNV